jgi:hypothetical protein
VLGKLHTRTWDFVVGKVRYFNPIPCDMLRFGSFARCTFTAEGATKAIVGYFAVKRSSRVPGVSVPVPDPSMGVCAASGVASGAAKVAPEPSQSSPAANVAVKYPRLFAPHLLSSLIFHKGELIQIRA